MAGTGRGRQLGSMKVTVMVMAALGSLLVWNGPAQAVAHKGLNGLIACGGTVPTAQANVVDFEIFTFNPDGSNRTNVTDESPLTDYNPVFTPDGKQILYETEFVGQAVDDTFELALMNPDGSGKSTLVANGKPEDIPRGYHPDGSQFVVQSNRDGNNEIYKINSDGTGQVRLTNNAFIDNWPKWSPDGTSIIFHSNRSGNNEIWSMDPFGGNLVNLTNSPATNDNTPEWSPDGTKIAFTRGAGSTSEIFVMDASGANPVNLTNNPGYDSIVTWSPDGNKIIWSRQIPGVRGVDFSVSGGNFEVFSAKRRRQWRDPPDQLLRLRRPL